MRQEETQEEDQEEDQEENIGEEEEGDARTTDMPYQICYADML